MAGITIRNLYEQTKARLRVRATLHGRSMENEVRHILREAVADDGERTGNLVGTIRKRFQSVGGVELRLRVREPMRELPKPAK